MKYIYTAFLVLCYSLVSSQTKLIQYMTRVPDASHFINYKTDIWQNKVFYKSQGYLMYFDGINLPKVVKKTNDNAFYSNQFKSTTNWMCRPGRRIFRSWIWSTSIPTSARRRT